MKYWFRLSDKIRFIIVGIFNAGVSYLIYAAMVFVLGTDAYQAALALAWIISSVTSFLTHKFFVFHVKGNIFKQYCKCCTTWVFSYLINACVLEFLVQKTNCNVYIAQLLAASAAAVFTYILFKKFAFRRK